MYSLKLVCACALLCQYAMAASVLPHTPIQTTNTTDLGVEFVPLEASTTEKVDKGTGDAKKSGKRIEGESTYQLTSAGGKEYECIQDVFRN